MQNILIAGASRGIGLALVRAFLERGERVHVVVRQPGNEALKNLAEQHPQRLNLIVSDLTGDQAAERIAAALDAPLDIALFNAGISARQTIEDVSHAQIVELFLTNAIAPLRIARALSTRMANDAVIAFMSSQMGSVELARSAEMPLYGASKAALNSLLRSWSRAADRPNACLLALHPGWVKTDMGGDNAPVEIVDSAAGLVVSLDAHRGKSGCYFVDYQQQTLPW
ncbi:SDR family oxidoreductase [Pseudomonas sp. LRF_L74]|uniref:SDR family oxidoreductase n=1 Tax=Pseudomonas sp. LRF_L74 TaxID=3369422 RepID=UPI003F6066D8